MGIRKFMPSIPAIVAAFLTAIIAKGALIWLASKSIYPPEWVANVFGVAVNGVTNYPGISLMLVGLAGLIGLATGPSIYRFGLKQFNHKGETELSRPKNNAASQVIPLPTEDLKDEQKQIDPDWLIGEAIAYVVDILFADKEPGISNIDTEDRPAAEAIIEKVKSGDLQTWGKRVEIEVADGARNLMVNIDREQFNLDDWRHRELLPLETSIPTEKKPQTRSVGRSDDHIQFTDLYVNKAQIKNIRWTSFAQDFDAFAAIKDLEQRIAEYRLDNWVNSVERDAAIERAENRIEAIKSNMKIVTSKDQIPVSKEEIFRERMRRIDVLFAEGVRLRNRAASLTVVDARTERKIIRLRGDLLREMDEISPTQSITLRTINQFDPSVHPPMNLQDPQSTLIFSEFLLRVQKILESKGIGK